VKVPAKQEGAPPADQAPAASPTPAPQAAPAPEKPKTEVKTVPRGDIAAPPASAPIGNPTDPGAAYLPQPADVIPTPPPPK